MTIMRKEDLAYDSLVLAGIGPKVELALEQFLNGQDQKKSLIFRCEEVFVWDPYGSLARSIISALIRYPTIQEIWILGQRGDHEPTFSILSKTVDKQTTANISYLFSHLFGLSADCWLNVTSDESSSAWKTAHMLKKHPLLPRPVTVKVALLDEQDNLVVQETSFVG